MVLNGLRLSYGCFNELELPHPHRDGAGLSGDVCVVCMEITVIRDVKTPSVTLGRLTTGDFRAFTCEDTEHEVKIPGETCIPVGRYKVVVTFSNRFKKHLPLLLDVPGFTGVRIHAGNTAGDTEGCILVGLTRTTAGVGNSRAAMAKLMELFDASKGKDIWLEVV